MATSIDWDLLLEFLKDPEKPLDKLAQKVGVDLYKEALQMGRELLLMVSKSKVPREYHPYVFFVLNRAREHWPPMSKQMREGLEVALELAQEGGYPPNSWMEIPEHGPIEDQIEELLLDMARWANTGMVAKGLKSYMKILSRYERQVPKADARVPKEKALSFLKILFEKRLETHPMWFPSPTTLYRFVKLMGF